MRTAVRLKPDTTGGQVASAFRRTLRLKADTTQAAVTALH
jgi:hypothetical protein